MTKISLLALIGAAAAHPSYGGHSKFHSKPAAGTGKPYPTGGWSGNYNSTQVPAGTASYEQGKTTTIDLTSTSTKTIYSTIYGTPASQSAVIENVSSKPAGSQCGPATVTVTATEKATVTVTPGASSAYSAGVVSSYVALPSSKAGEYDASSYIVVSSTPAAEKPSSSKPAVATSSKPAEYSSKPDVASSKASEYEAYTPSASLPAITSIAQKDYSAAVPSSTAASSSAAPKSSGTPTYSGTKRGLAYNDGELCSSFGSNFGFAYNWAQTESKDVGAPFIPMMHKVSDSTAEAWLANVDKAVKAGSKAVMGFNEPDHAEQANLTPEAACTAWKEYMNPIASSHPDVTILGPSVTNGGAPMGLGEFKFLLQLLKRTPRHNTIIKTLVSFYQKLPSIIRYICQTNFSIQTGSPASTRAALTPLFTPPTSTSTTSTRKLPLTASRLRWRRLPPTTASLSGSPSSVSTLALPPRSRPLPSSRRPWLTATPPTRSRVTPGSWSALVRTSSTLLAASLPLVRFTLAPRRGITE